MPRCILQSRCRCNVPEARWNLTLVVGNSRCAARESALAVDLMFEALGSESALSAHICTAGLADLAAQDQALRDGSGRCSRRPWKTPSAAVRARARKLAWKTRAADERALQANSAGRRRGAGRVRSQPVVNVAELVRDELSLRESAWISVSARRFTSKSSSPRRRSFVSWRFWLIMITGAWIAASMDRNRFSRMNG